MTKKQRRLISRRRLLQSAGAVGAAAVTGAGAGEAARAEPTVPSSTLAQPTSSQASEAQVAYQYLNVGEAESLEAIADHLIPADEHGPGALDARAVQYIDSALGGALQGSHDAYRSGLAAFDRYCQSSRGARFVDLSHGDRTSALIDVETGAASGAGVGFVGSSAAFFSMVRDHVLQGTFGDPFYGGNADFVGWDLIRYPGLRTAVTPEDQRRLESDELHPYRRSAYDWENFEKANVRAGRKERDHAD
jgi:gluconate 2-dehydrogenase gamma chain